VPKWRLAVQAVLMISMLSAVFQVAVAAGYNSYLRPKADYPGDRWTITGASSAWEALDDPVTEEQTPNNADYISNATTQSGNWGVDIDTQPLVGDSIKSATAWFYLSTPAAVKLNVRVNTNPFGGDTLLATGTFSGTGWHSVPVDLKASQALLDEVYFRFQSGTTTATRTVSATFLKVSLEPSPPKVYWGADVDGEVYGSEHDAPWDSSVWDTFENHTGKPVSILHFNQPAPWNQSFAPKPLNDVYARGAFPLISMGSGTVPLQEIASGTSTWDAAMKSWAEEVATYKKPLFLRWDWEMNLRPTEELPWTEQVATAPEVFVKAWQKFHDITEAAGASNITWVWCPNVSFTGSTSLNSLYPGNAYVDWTCMDGYNWGTNPLQPDEWKTFAQVFGKTYNEVASLAPNKPLMIGETASTEVGGNKGQWVTNALTREIPLTFPNIKALVWFNWNIKKGVSGQRMDWPIESSATSEAAFAQAIGHSYYAPRSPTEPTAGTKISPLP